MQAMTTTYMQICVGEMGQEIMRRDENINGDYTFDRCTAWLTDCNMYVRTFSYWLCLRLRVSARVYIVQPPLQL